MTAATPPFDLAAAHRFFSAQCFNDAWDLIGKADRTAEENEYLISVCHASLWHWRRRADCQSRHLSIGYWQLSRVYALLGEAANARKYGELCRDVSGAEGPLLRGYACEALARAAMVGGDRAAVIRHKREAHLLATQVEDTDDQALLVNDLNSIS
jgi:hypothetical protein